MQCHEFVERMQSLLDDRRPLESDAQLRAHARECVECRADLRTWEMLGSLGRNPPVPSAGFAERVVSQAGPATPWRARRGRTWILAGTIAALAASALLAVSLFRNPTQPKPGIGAVAGPDDPRIDAPNSIPAPDRSSDPAPAIAAHSTDDPQGDRSQAADDPMDMERLQQYSEAIQSLASQVPVESFDEVEEATPGLRPVRTSFSLAIGTIRRTMPPQRKAKPPSKPGKRDSGGLWTSSCELV